MSEATIRPGCEVCDLLPNIPPEYVLAENAHWNANVGSDQTFLGRTYITLKRHASELDELTPAEDQSFIVIRNALIRAIRSAFNPSNLNLSCLKNDAFHDDPDNTPPSAGHVHWHLLPRYGTRPVMFNDIAFVDPNLGGYNHSMHKRHFAQPETVRAIAAAIRNGLPEVSREPTPRTL